MTDWHPQPTQYSRYVRVGDGLYQTVAVPKVGQVVGYYVNGKLIGPMIVTKTPPEGALHLGGTRFAHGEPPHAIGTVNHASAGDVVSWDWIP